MDLPLLFKALLLGIVEGLTEFLPISSTGHLIVIAQLVDFHNETKVFEIVIQLGAIMAVIFEYRQRCKMVFVGLLQPTAERRFALHILLAFIPAAITGVLLIGLIIQYLFNPITVAMMLILGGFVILWVEQRPVTPTIELFEQISWQVALKIGLFQLLALIPGTSRSGATIIGAMLMGLNRKLATEFSFFLAIPTMVGATTYQIIRNLDQIKIAELPQLLVGFITAFIVALLTVRTLVRFVANHSYRLFAWYRILFGSFILLSWQLGYLNWLA